MKIYISADIEGIAGIVHWDEATRWKNDFPPFSLELMKEIQAACEGANKAGAKEIWIKDAHGVGRNLSFHGLPENIKLIRSFSGHPFEMMQEINDSFDAVIMIGYHSFAGSDENPLAHTLETDLSYFKINGQFASEFLINSYTASYVGVPTVFVSGDAGICNHVNSINHNIKTVSTLIGIGNSTISNHPDYLYKVIKNKVEESLKSDIKKCFIPFPDKFRIQIGYIDHTKAYKASFYPGVKKESASEISFETSNFFEVLRTLMFILPSGG